MVSLGSRDVDQIVDFNARSTKSHDLLLLIGFKEDFESLDIKKLGADLRLSIGKDDTIILKNVDVDDFDSSDVWFF